MSNFADDNTLSIANLSIEEIITHLQNDIHILKTWNHKNGMLLNETNPTKVREMRLLK